MIVWSNKVQKPTTPQYILLSQITPCFGFPSNYGGFLLWMVYQRHSVVSNPRNTDWSKLPWRLFSVLDRISTISTINNCCTGKQPWEVPGHQNLAWVQRLVSWIVATAEMSFCSLGGRWLPASEFRSGYPMFWKSGRSHQFPNPLQVSKRQGSVRAPGKRGDRLDISANIQPTDHISTAVEYWRDPRRTSGGRYHSVTIYASIKVVITRTYFVSIYT